MSEDYIEYTYSCCSEKLHGITIEALTALITSLKGENLKDLVVCMECGKAYEVTNHGMIYRLRAPFTPEELEGLKKEKELKLLERDLPTIKLTLSDLPMFICRECHGGTFDIASFNEKELILEFYNLMATEGHAKNKDRFILELCETRHAICKTCYLKTKDANYNTR